MGTLRLYTTRRRRPQVGDEKLIKGVLHVRQRAMVRDYLSGKFCYLVRDGKPCYEWVRKVNEATEHGLF